MKKSIVITGAGLALVAFILYLPTLTAEFVYDDIAIVVNDDYIHNPRNILDILTFRIFSRDMMDYNRPVYVFTTMIDSIIWGRDPVGYHLVNNIIHALNVVLLFGFLLHLLSFGSPSWTSHGRWIGAGFGALLYAIHPMNTEAVACATYREDPMMTFFLLASILLTRYFNRENKACRWGAVFGVVLCSFCAIGTKESGLVMPALLIAYWWFFRRKERIAPWIISIAGSATVIAVFTVASILMKFKGESAVYWVQPEFLGGSFLKMLVIEPSIFLFQVKQIFLPLGLAAAYGYNNLLYYPIQIAIPFLIILTVLCIWGSIRSRLFAFFCVLFMLLFAPVSNFMPKFQMVADRFLYVPMIAIVSFGAISGTWAWSHWKSKRERTILLCIMVIASSLYGILAIKRIHVWNNSISLWTDVIDKNPMLPMANDNLGYVLYEKDQLQHAAAQFERELQMTNGKSADAYTGFALLYAKMGRLAEAKECLEKAGNIDWHYKDAEKLRLSLRFTRRQVDVLKKIQAGN